MSRTLEISKDFKLPLDAATQTFAFIARKGAGKTYAAGKLAECFLDAGIQVIVLDLVGNWYGLRLSADGKQAAYDIPVIGGLRGDIPLEASGGHLIADIVADTGRSMIVDVSQFSKADRQRFALAFGERLWARKKAERNPSPVHVIIEESQLIVPERVAGDTAKMVGIYEEIIRLGRNYGIGVSMIGQRPQSINKEVLNMTECLFVLQVNGAHERKSLRDWITYHGAEKRLVDELPGLPVGTAYVWSPQWLRILQKVAIGKKKTFDASATPKVGSTQTRRDLKPLDLDDLKERMSETIEKAKAEDPRELRKEKTQLERRIAELEKQLSSPGKTQPATRVEVPVLADDQLKQLETIIAELRAIRADFDEDRTRFIGRSNELAESAERTAALIAGEIAKTKVAPVQQRSIQANSASRPASRPLTPRIAPPANRPLGSPDIGKAAQRIIDSLAWWESIGITEPARMQVAFVAGYTVNGHFNNLCGGLRTKELVDYPSGNRISLKSSGREFAALPDESPTRDDLHRRVREKLSESQRRLFDPITEAGKRGEGPLSNEELATRAGYTVNGHFNNLRGSLRSLGLIDYIPGGSVASEMLFPPGLD